MKKELELLISEVSAITASGLPMMEGREKLDVKEVIGQVLTVDDYGYLEGDEGEYVVITMKGHEGIFIYGSSVVTQAFKKLDEKISSDKIEELLKIGLTFKLEEKISKSKRKYTCITFFPK